MWKLKITSEVCEGSIISTNLCTNRCSNSHYKYSQNKSSKLDDGIIIIQRFSQLSLLPVYEEQFILTQCIHTLNDSDMRECEVRLNHGSTFNLMPFLAPPTTYFWQQWKLNSSTPQESIVTESWLVPL